MNRFFWFNHASIGLYTYKVGLYAFVITQLYVDLTFCIKHIHCVVWNKNEVPILLAKMVVELVWLYLSLIKQCIVNIA